MPIPKQGLQHHSPQTANPGLRLSGIWYQHLSAVSHLSSVLEEMPTAQLYTIFTLSKGVDEGTLVEVPAQDPEAALIQRCSWKTFRGTPRTLKVYSSSVVFPPLLLLLLLLLELVESWYSSIALSTLLLDEETSTSNILKFEGKPKNKDKENT